MMTVVIMVVALVVTAVVPPHLDLLVSLADLSKIPPLLKPTALPPKPGEALVQVLGRLEVGKGSSPGGVHGHVGLRAFVAATATNSDTTKSDTTKSDTATVVDVHVAVPPVRNEEAGQAGKGQKAEDRAGESLSLPVPILVVDPVSSAVGVAPRSAAARSASRHPRRRECREEALVGKEGSDCRRSSYHA